MAEIRVQEKRGGLMWLWMLLLLLLVALAVWYFLGNRDADGTAEPAPATTPAASPAADPSLPGHPPASRMVFVRA